MSDEPIVVMKPEDLNRDLINKLALKNPVVANTLEMYIRGDFTYEQALIGMVTWLVTQNEALTRLQIKNLSAQLPDGAIRMRFGSCKDSDTMEEPETR